MKIKMSYQAIKTCEEHARRMCSGFTTRSFKNGKLQNHDVYTTGKIGEYAVGLWLKENGIKIIHKPFRDDYKTIHPDDDFVVDIGGRKFQLEVRCKARNVDPQDYFECCTDSIKPHLVYVFASYNRNTQAVDILGFMDEKKLRQCARPILAGTDNCNFLHKANEYNVVVSQLTPPPCFAEYLSGQQENSTTHSGFPR